MALNFDSFNIIKRLSEIESRLKQTESTVSTHGGNISDIIRDLQNKQTTIENIVKDLQNKQTQLNTQVGQIQKALETSQNAFNNAQTAYDQASKAQNDVVTAYNEAVKAQNASQQAFNQATTSMDLTKSNLSNNYNQLVSGFSGLATSGNNLAAEFISVKASVAAWSESLRSWSNTMASLVNTSVGSINVFYNTIAGIDINRYIGSVAILPKLGGPTIEYLKNPVEFIRVCIDVYNKAKNMSNDIKATTDYSRAIYSAESDQIGDLSGRFTNVNNKFTEMATAMANIKTQFENLARNLPT